MATTIKASWLFLGTGVIQTPLCLITWMMQTKKMMKIGSSKKKGKE
jgi:hypothetical protein